MELQCIVRCVCSISMHPLSDNPPLYTSCVLGDFKSIVCDSFGLGFQWHPGALSHIQFLNIFITSIVLYLFSDGFNETETFRTVYLRRSDPKWIK